MKQHQTQHSPLSAGKAPAGIFGRAWVKCRTRRPEDIHRQGPNATLRALVASGMLSLYNG